MESGRAVERWQVVVRLMSDAVRRRQRGHGTYEAVKSIAMVMRALADLGGVERLSRNPAFAHHVTTHPAHDPMFAMRHRNYLLRGLTLRQRVAAAAAHFEAETARCDRDYQARVYGGAGLTLWSLRIEDRRYDIVLRDSGDLRYEGPLTVALRCDERELHVTSFAWAPAEILAGHAGAGASPMLFIARNQSLHLESPQMSAFRTDFPQNAPAYFCMAAMMGLARAHGLDQVAAVDSERQVAFKPDLSSSFKQSYANFWCNFGGEPVGRVGYLIPVPARVAPLESLPQKHRARARARRRWWAEIGDSASQVLKPHLLASASLALATQVQPTLPRALAGTQVCAWLPVLLELVPAGLV